MIFATSSYQTHNSELGENIDTQTGALVFNQGDISVYGRGGMGIKINRSYNSKHFKARAAQNIITYGKDLLGAATNMDGYKPVEFPQWHGWAGQGWQFNVGGVLYTRYMEAPAPKKRKQVVINEIMIQLGGGQAFSFDPSTMKSIDKKSLAQLEKTDTGGYVLTDDLGVKYHFGKLHFSKIERLKYRFIKNDGSGYYRTFNNAYKAYYLEKIENKYGDFVQIEYETISKYKVRKQDQRMYEEDYSVRADIKVYEMRPIKLVNSIGKQVDLYYEDKDSLRISKLGYDNDQGKKIFFKYRYDKNDCLIEVQPPLGKATRFKYDFYNQYLNYVEDKKLVGIEHRMPIYVSYSPKRYKKIKDDYQDDGYLIAEVKYPTGGTSKYQYSWYDPWQDPKVMKQNNIKPEYRKFFANYYVNSKTIGELATWRYQHKYGEIYQTKAGPGFNWGNIEIINPDGGVKFHMYHQGLPYVEVDPDGSKTSYIYDYDEGFLLKKFVRKGESLYETRFLEYDQYGNKKKILNLGLVREPGDDKLMVNIYQYEVDDMATKNHLHKLIARSWVEDRAGQKRDLVGFKYDNYGNIIEKRLYLNEHESVADSITYRYKYDEYGNLVSEEFPENSQHKRLQKDYYYDQNKALLVKTASIVAGVEYASYREYYEPTGRLKLERNEAGQGKRYVYDDLGRILKTTDLQDYYLTTTTKYYDSANKVQTKDFLGNESITIFDALGREKEIINPDGTKIKKYYNKKMPLLLWRQVGIDGRVTEYEYDNMYRVRKEKVFADLEDANNGHNPKVSSITYDDSLGLKTLTNPAGQKKRIYFDAYANIVRVEDWDQQIIRYTYNIWGKLTKMCDAKGNETNYYYDDQNRLLVVERPDRTKSQFVYDKLGNIIEQTDAEGHKKQFKYDLLGRLLRTTYYDGRSFEYRYGSWAARSSFGKLVYVKDFSSEREFSYDERGRISEVSVLLNSSLITKNLQPITTSYEYDKADRITRIDYPNLPGTTVGYDYDKLGRLKSVSLRHENVDEKIASYKYDELSRLQKMNYYNGIKEEYDYDTENRLTAISGVTALNRSLYEHQYSYDLNGNRDQYKYSVAAQGYRLIDYTYDDGNQLTGVSYFDKDNHLRPVAQMNYRYDANNNRTSYSYPYGKVDYSYDQNMDRLLELTDNDVHKSYRYDVNGNLISKKIGRITALGNLEPMATFDYVFDADNRLVSVAKNNQQIMAAAYDYQGLRLVKSTHTQTSAEEEVLSASNSVTVYNYGLGTEALTITDGKGSLKTLYVMANGKKLLAYNQKQKEKLYYHNDNLGSPIILTDEQQNIKQTYFYGPFGNYEFKHGYVQDDINPYQYTGQEQDADIGLMYYNARYYDSEVGRFISEDPAAAQVLNPKTLNRYVYCVNNPLIYTDPSGEFIFSALFVAGKWLLTKAVEAYLTSLVIDMVSHSDKNFYQNVSDASLKAKATVSDPNTYLIAFAFDLLTGKFAAQESAKTPVQQAAEDAAGKTAKNYSKETFKKSIKDAVDLGTKSSKGIDSTVKAKGGETVVYRTSEEILNQTQEGVVVTFTNDITGKYTVQYSRLSEVFVDVGQELGTDDIIGKCIHTYGVSVKEFPAPYFINNSQEMIDFFERLSRSG